MTWIKCTDQLAPTGWLARFLVIAECETGVHCMAANLWQYPCCQVNIAYHLGNNKWQWATREPMEKHLTVTHWMPLPDKP